MQRCLSASLRLRRSPPFITCMRLFSFHCERRYPLRLLTPLSSCLSLGEPPVLILLIRLRLCSPSFQKPPVTSPLFHRRAHHQKDIAAQLGTAVIDGRARRRNSMDMELEARPRQPLMLKEWLELESSAELSREGFGCYPRHLAAELRNASGRRRNGDVIARVSAAVRAALLRTPPSARARETGALPRSLSRRLRVGFWKKRRGEREETDRRVPSCSATVACGRRDGGVSSPAMSPRRASWEGSRVSVNGAGLGSRLSHEAEVAGPECETACRLDEEREQEQRLSPVSVMDFPGQDEDEGNNETGGDGHGEEDGDNETISPTFARSMANIRRASQLLLQKIRQFEQLAELDLSEVDTVTTATEDASCNVVESDMEDEAIQDLLGILQLSSPVATCRFQKLLEDFFRDGLAWSCHCERPDDPKTAKLLLSTVTSWLDGRHYTLRSDWKADMEEIEQLGWWRRFREDEQKMLAVDVEGSIFWSLMEELVDDLHSFFENFNR